MILKVDNRSLFVRTVIYGAADVLVLLVGGFLLLPIYTRTLSQADFGSYVVVKANIEIISCLMHFGLVSAVSRLYFDHSKDGRQVEYLSSVVTLFLVNLGLCVAVVLLFGDKLWSMLSPGVPTNPLLWFSLAIAAASFFSMLGLTWLRLEGRAVAVAAVQVTAALVLGLASFGALVWLDLGLPGLLTAFLASTLLSALVVPWRFGRKFRLRWQPQHVRESLQYAAPIVVGLASYFVLNRVGTLILQHYVPLEEIAVYGLAQQLAQLVVIAGAAFGKAMQPAIFSATVEAVPAILGRGARMLYSLQAVVACAVCLFAADIVALVAPRNYNTSYDILLILLVAAFVYTLNLVSDTVFLSRRKPKTSASISLFGAFLCAALGALLIPRYGVLGAAFGTLIAFIAMTLTGHEIARRLTGYSYMPIMLGALGCVVGTALLSHWLHELTISWFSAFGVKLAVATALIGAWLRPLFKKTQPEQCLR